jgi:hypothetical protein
MTYPGDSPGTDTYPGALIPSTSGAYPGPTRYPSGSLYPGVRTLAPGADTIRTYPGNHPGSSTFPGIDFGPNPPDPPYTVSGNPQGIDESGYWADLDSSRPLSTQWLAVSLTTGKILCELPSLVSSDPFKRTIGQYESQSAQLLVTPDVAPEWLDATTPWTTAMVAVRGLPGSEVVQWGGVILRRQRGTSNAVTLTLATPECYLDRRYTGNYTTDPSGVGATLDQAVIVSQLVTQFAVANQGLPISVVNLATILYPQLLTFADYDDKTVYSNLQTLSSLINGPEWTAHWKWDRTANTITPVFYVGNRIGTAVQPGLGPNVTFDSANLIDFTLDENYGSGFGANDALATSSGQGTARPSAQSVASNFAGRPRIQQRFQPATSITSQAQLQQHADNAESLLANGVNTITLRVSSIDGPQLGLDWDLGDDVGYELTGPAFPGGFAGVGRVIGYESDQISTNPILYVPSIG